MMKTLFAAGAALALAACGGSESGPREVQSDAGAAIDERALADAVTSAVDREAIERLARDAVEGAVTQALHEALPAAELAAVGTVIDEEALARGVDKAIDGKVLHSAVRGAIQGPVEDSNAPR